MEKVAPVRLKLEELHAVAFDDNVARKHLPRPCLRNWKKDKKFLTEITFNDTAAFHVSR